MPLRTCVACRAVLEKDSLVRLVARDGAVVVDHTRAAPGRGAYLCPSVACVEKAARSAPWHRALRTGVRSPDPETLRGIVTDSGGDRK